MTVTHTNNYEQMTDRELDALVAEKVMGYRFWLEKRGRASNEYELAVTDYDGREPWMRSRDWKSQMPRYRQVTASEAYEIGFHGRAPCEPTQDISQAFRVVEAMRERGFEVSLDSDNYYNVWDCEFHKDGATYMNGDESLPHAICIAALRACE